jgi:Protein of unknown function (DUF3592)
VSLPEPVRAHRARPAAWVLAALVLAGLIVLDEVNVARDDRAWARQAAHLDGVVAGPPRGGGVVVPVEYTHPVTGQRITLDVDTFGAGAVLRAGDPVALAVDRDDPDRVAIVGDRRPTVDVWGVALVLVVPLAALALRWWSVERTARLVRSPATTFAMLGAIPPRRRLLRRPMLHLYPLDAAAGAPALCAVPLVTTAGCPVAGPAFAVQVKGVPRPLGRVAARVGSGDDVLWPAARAGLTASWPRPAQVVEPVPPARVDRGALPLGVVAGRLQLRTRWREAVGPYALALAAAVAFGALVTALTLLNAADAHRTDAGRVAAVGLVVDRVDTLFEQTVTMRLAYDGQERTPKIDVASAADYTVGRMYPLRIDPALVDGVRPSRESYDRVDPIVAGWLPAVAAAVVLAGVAATWRRSRAVARHGPWAEVCVSPGSDDTLVLGDRPPGRAVRTGYLRGAIAGRAAVASLRGLWQVGGVLTRAAEKGVVSAAVVVAGRPEPGGVVALVEPDGGVHVVACRLSVPQRAVGAGADPPR